MINLQNFHSNLLKSDKKSYKSIDFSYIGYITIKDLGHVNIHSENLVQFIIDNGSRWYIEKSNGNKYIIFASADKNNKVLSKYTELWAKTKNLIETISGKSGEFEKRSIKIMLESDDDLPLGKILKLHNLTN